MHKETVVAILIGLGLGLVVAMAIFRFRQAVTTPTAEKPAVEESEVMTDQVSESGMIELSNLTDGTVSSSADFTFSGKLKTPSTAVLFVNEIAQVVKVDESLAFSEKVELQPGVNVLTVIALDESGLTEQVQRLVVFDAVEADEAESKSTVAEDKETSKTNSADSTTSETTTDDSEPSPASTTRALLDRIGQKFDSSEGSVEQTAQEAIDQLRRGYVGEVERVSDEAIRLKTLTGSLSIPIENLDNVRKNDKKVDATIIEVGNWLLVIGANSDSETDTTVTPDKALVFVESPLPRPLFATLGSLKSQSRSKLTIIERKTGESTELTLDPKVRWLAVEDAVSAASQFTEDLSVLVTGFVEETIRTATTVRALAPFSRDDNSN